MDFQKVVPVVLSVLVIVLVAVVQERSRWAAAILASMPLSAPLALWIVYSATGGDHEKAAEFAGSMVLGVLATCGFVLGTWWALRRGWPFGWVLGVGTLVWLSCLGGGRLVQRFFG